MNISGLQKLSMVDYPAKLSATVFTGGCNLRCPFCHNALLVTAPQELREHYSEEEVLSFLRTRRGLLDGVVISGGEPLIQDDVEDFAAAVKSMGFAVKLDTNGCFPDKLRSLIKSGLVDYVAMDIKNSLSLYPRTVGVSDFDTSPIEKSASFLMDCAIPYEFRTTLVREFHASADLLEIGHWLRGAKQYFLQNFVDSGGLIADGLHGFSADEMRAFAQTLSPFFGQVALRGVTD